MFTSPLFQIKLYLLSTVLPSGFQSSRELWNPLSKAVPGKFHRSGRHGKCNCLQDRANSHRSLAWQIALIFNTDNLWHSCTLRPEHNAQHFADNNFRFNLLNENCCILFNFQWSLFSRVELTISHHWYRYWPDAEQMTSHYLNQWWIDLLPYKRVTRPQWINSWSAKLSFKIKAVFLNYIT